MSALERRTLPFSSGEPGEHHYCQWVPEHPVAWLHIMHGMSEHGARYAEFAEFLNQQGILVTAGDHRGHGQTGKAMDSSYHLADADGWEQMVDDQWQLINHIETRLDLPFILMGHSMGSFMATRFCQKYASQIPDAFNHKLCGLILSGSSYDTSSLYKSVSYVAHFERWRLGLRNPSSVLEKLSFGSFNNAFKPNRTVSDWLSRDEKIVDQYVDDYYCGGPLSTQSWCDFLAGMADLSRPEAMASIDKALPIYLISGALDPVSKQGLGIEKLKCALIQAGIKRVDVRLYEEARHEILNETNRADVFKDLLYWLAGLKSEL